MSVIRVCRGPTRVATFLLITLGAVAGCGDDDPMGGNAPTGGAGGSGAQNPNGGGPPEGGAGGGPQGGGGGVVMLEEFNDVSTGRTPYDATPNQDGSIIFFTGEDAAGGAGVFQVASTGGNATAVATGDPFVAPFGIATATSGDFLFVTDPAADEAGGDRGAIVKVNINGETEVIVEGFSPLGIEVADVAGEDKIYFTGRNASGEAGVFSAGISGGAIDEVFAGAPIVDPSGIAVSAGGDIYFIDTVGSGARSGRILTLEQGNGPPVVVVDNISVGYPAGLALSSDNTELWVSALDPVTRTDVLLRVNTATQAVTEYTGDADTKIDGFEEPAGIHRAKNADIFSFVDSRAGGTGIVFALQP